QTCALPICRHGHCFDISRYGYVNLLLKSSPKTNYSKRSFDNRHQILEYGMYDVVLEKIIQFISDTPSIRNILDVGCGEGFYARQIQQRTEQIGRASCREREERQKDAEE